MQCWTSATVTGHYNSQMCLSMLLSMVMAGSGNLKVLELCRVLHKRTRTMTHQMALGMLVLGGGRYTPTRPSLPFSVRSTTIFLPTAQITEHRGLCYEEITAELMAPTMLPELQLLNKIQVKGPLILEAVHRPEVRELHILKGRESTRKQVLTSQGNESAETMLACYFKRWKTSYRMKNTRVFVQVHSVQRWGCVSEWGWGCVCVPYEVDLRDWKNLLSHNVVNRNSEVRTFKVVLTLEQM
ncbi:anaphase-promoting complex subunit 1 isoform X2 [Salmo trutta]|uniref:anaphase-promoting complex subunit 1 isoform X2 n=1 Tax=Salmo trutta TaxID=8032 RepID=UPI0011320832|nr:anaphase-promoting complex subunit 1-like isoform X2 [Salmo trutta]